MPAPIPSRPLHLSFFVRVFKHGPIAQLDRASDFESEGWAFESLWDRHHLPTVRKKNEYFGKIFHHQ